jgi:hypothetical protein
VGQYRIGEFLLYDWWSGVKVVTSMVDGLWSWLELQTSFLFGAIVAVTVVDTS